MKEQELNTLMSVVSDPICNVYKIESRKDIEEEISQITQQKRTVIFKTKRLNKNLLIIITIIRTSTKEYSYYPNGGKIYY